MYLMQSEYFKNIQGDQSISKKSYNFSLSGIIFEILKIYTLAIAHTFSNKDIVISDNKF